MFVLGNIIVTVTILAFFNAFQKCTSAEAGLPLIQISHDELGDDYPEMQEEVHLEDFFWTGSGDGPPDFLKKVHTGISKGKDVIVKTETVVATVYVDGNNEIDIPICLDCFGDDGGGGGTGVNWGLGGSMPPLNYSATDRRYWLLTVMSGFYTQKDNPMLEEKLARLYRLAFTRQQTRHLGINGVQQIAGISVSTGRERRQRTHLDVTTEQAPKSDVEVLDMSSDSTNTIKKTLADVPFPPRINTEWATSSEETDTKIKQTTTKRPMTTTVTTEKPTTLGIETETDSTDFSAYVTLVPWELIQHNVKSEKQVNQQSPPATPLPFVYRPQQPQGDRVRVIIHNITQVTENDVQNRNIGGAYDEEFNLKIDERPIANQTELIYSVLVNERPVLAITAANDMKFVSQSEVSKAIGKDVYIQAEPYLREPLATPLAPATHSSSVGFFDSIQNNPALVIVSSLAILLLLLLLVALMLMGRAHRKESQVNRASSRNELLSESQSVRPSSRGTTAPDTGRATSHSRDVGVQNFSFENETGQPVREARIHFPEPPNVHSRRDSISSTDNTSDSSVYCPINPPSADVQRILDEKAATLFERHKRRHHQYDRAEGHEDTVYTSVVSEKKSGDKLRHAKTKRRYLSENRVGSLETSPTQHRSIHSSGDEMISPDAVRRSYEAFNPHNNYHRNKLLHQKTVFADKEYDEQLASTQAINKEIIRALQPSERSSDTASVGSFLSMSSVRAFPKSALPEPLNRVLDPVFVTYYDNVDDLKPAAVHQASARSQKTSLQGTATSSKSRSLNKDAIATIDSFPSPKAPMKSTRAASQSDNPDPGVVGPVVWERHKKRIHSADANMDELNEIEGMTSGYSPTHDPSAIRNHYEGLLEGAIQMYSSQDDLPMPLPTRDFTNSRRATKRENRGSSAGLPSYASKFYNTTERPATAQPEKTTKSNHSTQPPSPTTSAWGGGSMHGSHSPIVRPLSAGPFHRPESIVEPRGNGSRENAAATAPLIEAIQTEMRRFRHEQN